MAIMSTTEASSRMDFWDNLRTAIVFLVILNHVGWIYEGSGILSSVWIVNDPLRNNMAGIINMIIDMFMMPTMFLISGFFTPKSIQRKSTRAFIFSRLKRLILPWMIAMATLIPLYKVIFLTSRGLPHESLFSYFHLSGDILINQGWLWFLPVLFLFDLTYLIISKITIPLPPIGTKTAVFLVFLVGTLYSFLCSYLGWIGWTKTIFVDFQNERLFIYFLIFVLGAFLAKRGVFTHLPRRRILYYATCGTIWIPMNVYIIFLLNMLFNPGQFIFSGLVDRILVWTGFNLSMLGMVYIMVCTFRFYLNKSNRFTRLLSRQSYGVYIIHFIIMGGVAWAVLNGGLNSPVKYIGGVLVTFLLSHLLVFSYHFIKATLIPRREKYLAPEPALSAN